LLIFPDPLSTHHWQGIGLASFVWHPVCEWFIVRSYWLLLISLGLTGCAASQPALPPITTNSPPACGAAALVFDVPITLDQAPIDLSRSNHGQAAFAGFDDSSTSYYDIVTDDRESSNCTDQFTRESVSERVGSTRR
jgi:hypothetical protein